MCSRNRIQNIIEFSHKFDHFDTWRSSDMCNDSAATSQRTNCVFLTKTNGVLQSGIILIPSKSQTEQLKILCVHE